MDSPPVMPGVLAPGTRIDRYEIVRRLGAGGVGDVYEALHVGLGEPVALKLLQPQYASNKIARVRFRREARAASRVRHPNIVRVTDFGEHGGALYLVMEYLDGEDLKALLKREGALDARRTADLMLPVLAGVYAAHAAGVLHRDLKPANLFVSRTANDETLMKVLDFGLTRMVDRAPDDPEVTVVDASIGTPRFMSPEHIAGGGYITAKSDQFSLGAILYLCAIAETPFSGASEAATMALVQGGCFVRPSDRLPSIPAPLDAAICRALAHDPDERFASVLELGVELYRFASPEVQMQHRRTFGGSSLAHTLPLGGRHQPPTLPPRSPFGIALDPLAFASRAPQPTPFHASNTLDAVPLDATLRDPAPAPDSRWTSQRAPLATAVVVSAAILVLVAWFRSQPPAYRVASHGPPSAAAPIAPPPAAPIARPAPASRAPPSPPAAAPQGAHTPPVAPPPAPRPARRAPPRVTPTPAHSRMVIE